MPLVRLAMVSWSRPAMPVASMALFCSAGSRAASSSTRKVMRSSRGRSPHHLGLRVSTIRCRVRSSDETMNGPADGPGPESCALLNASGVRSHALGQQHAVAGEHAAPLGVWLGEGDHRLAVVDAPGHRLHPFAAIGAGDGEGFVDPAGGMDLAGNVLPAERRAVRPRRLRIDGVGDHLRVGPGEFDAAEVIGVDRRGAVRPDDERARQSGFQHAADVGGVAVDVQCVEVRREFGERQIVGRRRRAASQGFAD